MRLIPPKQRPRGSRKREDEDTRLWAKALHQRSRSLFVIVAGNVLMLLLLVGGPVWRGQARARATWQAHAAFASCLLGAKAASPAGIGAPDDEPERLSAQLFAGVSAWPGRCHGLLGRIAPESAIFLLPGVKHAELRVREAVRVLRVELGALSRFKHAERVPVRPLLALAQLRQMIRAQSEEAGIVELPLHSVIDGKHPAPLAAPAELPLYASRDAILSVWGNDLLLRVLAVDGTGVSYLEAQPGIPYRRSRMVRPASLRGVRRTETSTLLVWATPEARCRERADGCLGKTTGFAVAEEPVLELPKARFVAAHLAGRPDRSLALVAGKLHMTVGTLNRAKTVRDLLFSEALMVDETLPPIVPAPAWEAEQQDVVLFASAARMWALASGHDETMGTLSLADSAGSEPLVSFARPTLPWVTGCSEQDGIGYVTGDGATLVLGRVTETARRAFEPVAVATRDVIHDTDPGQDRVVRLCRKDGALSVVHTSDDELIAVFCADGEANCRSLSVAKDVRSFAALASAQGAIIAFSGDSTTPQMFVRTLDVARATLSEARIPSACWASSRGMCGRPILARLGARVVLGARQGTDLVLLESADEGVRWTTPSVL